MKKIEYIVAIIMLGLLCYYLTCDNSIMNSFFKIMCWLLKTIWSYLGITSLDSLLMSYQKPILIMVVIYSFGIQLFVAVIKNAEFGEIILFIYNGLLIIGSILLNKNIIEKPDRLYYIYFGILVMGLVVSWISIVAVWIAGAIACAIGVWLIDVLCVIFANKRFEGNAFETIVSIAAIIIVIAAIIIGIALKAVVFEFEMAIILMGIAHEHVSSMGDSIGTFAKNVAEGMEQDRKEMEQKKYQEDMYNLHRREVEELEKISRKK